MITHRAIWMQHHGDIPEGHVIHHINGDHYDDRIENLAAVTVRQHRRLHLKLAGKPVCDFPTSSPDTPPSREHGPQLRELRRTTGVKQRVLADIIGTSGGHLSAVENGWVPICEADCHTYVEALLKAAGSV